MAQSTYYESYHRIKSPKRPKRRWLIFLLIFIVVGAGFIYTRPTEAIYPTNLSLDYAQKTVKLAWPNGAEASVGAIGYGILASHGNQAEKPTASVAKLVTALTVLNKFPLAVGQSGPTITLTNADVAIYSKYLDEDGSTAKVAAGEKITEYQALEAMLLPSANNVADSLAIWAFGSLPAYNKAANDFIKTLGLYDTVIGKDASGFLPSTVSNSRDLTLLGMEVLHSPVLRQIVSEKSAVIPVAGRVPNVNWLLGEDGIFGIKTGNTNQAGGVYVFAAKYALSARQNITIVGAVQGTKTFNQALDAAIPLLNSVKANFSLRTIVKSGQPIAIYKLPWGGNVAAVASKNLVTPVWSKSYTRIIPSLHPVFAPSAAATTIGLVSAAGSNDYVPVVLKQSVPSPPWWYRLLRHNIRHTPILSFLSK